MRAGTSAPLAEADAHYVTRVLRLAEGCVVEAMDAADTVWSGHLRWVDGQPVFDPTEVVADADESTPMRLIAGLIKGERWESLLEKATELGVTAIVPLDAERSVVRIPAAKVAGRLARWRRICDHASRQSRRAGRVELVEPTGLADALGGTEGPLLLVDEQAPDAPWPAAAWSGPVTLIVGPEGGFTDEERTAILTAGAQQVGLGPTTLRTETAAMAALAILRLRREGLV